MTNNWLSDIKIAHRGLHNNNYPENSLGAFDNAIKHKFTIELDIQLLNDDNIAVFHDNNLFRMCGEDVEINRLTIEQLSKYHLNNTAYTIPSLQQALELIDGRTPIIIEIKPSKHRYKFARIVYSILKNYKGDFAIQSFDHLIIRWFKIHAPEVIRGMLSSKLKEVDVNWLYKLAVSKLMITRLARPDFISYHHTDLPNKYTTKYSKKYNIPILAWTITSQDEEEQILQYADNIIFENYIPKANN